LGYCKDNKMLKWINCWDEDFLNGYKKTLNLKVPKAESMLCWGMGGSGIGGRILEDIASFAGSKQVSGNGGYSIPNWVNSDTLFISISYSGNTEETLTALNTALDKRTKILALTSNGILEELAQKHNFDHIKLQPGRAPRANLSEMLGVLLGIAERGDFIQYSLEKAEKDKNNIKNYLNQDLTYLKRVAEEVSKRDIVFIGNEKFKSVGLRWVTQLNENAKKQAEHIWLPEMNHNFVVGKIKDNQSFIFFALEKFESEKDKKRRLITEKILREENENITIHSISIDEENYISAILKLLIYSDMFSIFTAEHLDEDPLPIKPIEKLKNLMSG